MFEINYNLSNHFVEDVEVNESTLRYSLLLGSLTIKDGENSIIMNWDWIPLLDVALSLKAICVNFIKHDGIREYEFTESDAKLFFHKIGAKIQISSSFTENILQVDTLSFIKAIELFTKNFIKEIHERSYLKNNSIFLAMARDILAD